MVMFFVHYIVSDLDFYEDTNLFSKLDPSNSKHILDALHDILKNLNLKDLNVNIFGKGGGPDPDPDFFPYMCLFLDTEKEPVFIGERVGHNDISLDPSELNYKSKIVDDHNKNLVYPLGKDMIAEKNKLISINIFLDYGFHTPYGIANLCEKYGFDSTNFIFYHLKHSITKDVKVYDALLASKIYYESEDKTLLPYKFKNLWMLWHKDQIGLQDILNNMKISPENSLINFFKKDVAYNELNDNILIVGLGILCKYHIYTNLYNEFGMKGLDLSKLEFYTKAWEYYQEAIQKYYPFFHHYNWFCKLYILERYSESDILDQLASNNNYEKRLSSVPPLFEYILNGWNFKPDWNNDIRPDIYPDFKQYSTCILGSSKVHFVFNLKNFFENKLEIKSFIPQSDSTIESDIPFIKQRAMDRDMFSPSIPKTASDYIKDPFFKKPINITLFYQFPDNYFWK